MKRESSDKTRFCVSHDGLSNVLETFCLPCFMLKNKTKNMFFELKGLQYIGAWAPIYRSPSNIDARCSANLCGASLRGRLPETFERDLLQE